MTEQRKTVVVVGHGMVGHRFCEEPRAAYDRVGLTQFFAHRDARRLLIANLDWYREQGIEIHIGDRVATLDRRRRVVRSDRGVTVPYDKIVLATGSYPFVPAMPGTELTGVFLYRTIEDLQLIAAYAEK